MATVLVTGATGTLGREVVHRLLLKQHQARILSHKSAPTVPAGVEVITGELASGAGLREAVTGVDAIIHCASSFQNAAAVDIEGTRLLLQMAHASGSPHFIYMSIVGVDRSAYAYYTAKRATEVVIEQGPLPWTIVRARPLKSRGVAELFKFLQKRTGIDGKRVSAHNCRRYMATTPLASGRSPFDVQRQMGHTTLTMTNHYASLNVKQLQQSHDLYSPLRAKDTGNERESSSTGYWDIE